MDIPNRTRPSPWRSLRRVAMGVAAAFVLAGIAFALLAARLEANVRESLQAQAAALADRLGRKITLGEVEVSLGAIATASVRDIAILPAEGDTGASALPLLTVSSIRLKVAVLPLVLSRGRQLEIVSIDVQAPEVTIVRRPDGTLSTDDVRARAAAGPALPASPRPHRLSAIDRLTIDDGALRFFDGAASSPMAIESIHAEARAPGLDEPLSVVLDAAALSPDRNVRASVLLGPPRGLATDLCPLRRADVRVASAPLAPAAPSVTTSWIDVSSSALSLEVSLSCETELFATGSVSLTGLRLGERPDAAELRAAVDARLQGTMVLDRAHDALELPSFELEIGSALVKGQASLGNVGTKPTLRSLSAEMSVDGEQLASLAPTVFHGRGVESSGAIALRAALVEEQGVLHGPASAHLPQLRLRGERPKDQPGEAIPVDVRGELELGPCADCVALRAASVRLGERVQIDGSFAATDLRAPHASVAISASARGPLEDLLALAPPSRRPAAGTFRGPFRASATLRGTRASWRGDARVDLTAAKLVTMDFVKARGVPLRVEARGAIEGDTLRLDGAHVRLAGSELRLGGTARGSRDLELRYDADVSSLASLLALRPARAPQAGDATFDGHVHASGSLERHGGRSNLSAQVTADELHVATAKLAVVGHGNLSVRAAWEGSRGRVDIRDARWTMPGLTLEGATLVLDAHRFEARVESLAIDVAQLSRSFPGSPEWPDVVAGAKLAASAHVTGDTQRPWDARVELRRSAWVSRAGTIRGDVVLDGVAPPRSVALDVTADTLNLGDLGALGSAGWPPSASVAARAPPSGLSVAGRVHIGRLQARGLSLERVAIDAAFADGGLRFRELRADVFGGTLNGSGSRLELRDGVPRVSLRASVADLDLASLPVPAGARVEGLRGRAGMTLELDAAGASGAEMAASARGSVRLALRDVHLETEGSLKAQLVNPLLARASARASAKHVKRVREVDVARASASFRIDAGAATTLEPMRIESGEGTLTLSGRLGFDKTLRLRGALTVPPSAIDRATGGKLVPAHDLTIRMTVEGSGGEPRVRIENLAEAIRGLRGSFRNAIAKRRTAGSPAR